MDIPLLTEALIQMLAPAMQQLVQGGEEPASRVGEELGVGAWEKAKALWQRLRGRVKERPAAEEAARDVARAPEDPDALGAFRLQLKKILAEDEDLAAEVARLLGGSKDGSYQAIIPLQIRLDLPGSVAREARDQGLLESLSIELLLREELRRRRIDHLFEMADRLAAVAEPPLTEEEVNAEIQAVRAARRAHAGRR
jgi:hypothetical protein